MKDTAIKISAVVALTAPAAARGNEQKDTALLWQDEWQPQRDAQR
jgi:hypothetical protein